MTGEELMQLAREYGFTNTAILDVSTLKALPDVRDMCAVNTCGAYGTKWSCPPGCGELSECEAKMKKYSKGIIVQYIGDIEDTMDWEGIMEAQQKYNEIFLSFMDKFYELYPDGLPLGAGGCTRCKKCTYPDAPCRFPDKMFSSMEAYGLFVSDVCRKNNIPYNYGGEKMCYTGCYLYND